MPRFKNFTELSTAGQRYSLILLSHRSNRDPSGEVSSSFVRTLHHELLAQREFGGPKIGWPRWAFVENKTRDGHGFVPIATEADRIAFEQAEQMKKEVKKTLQKQQEAVKLKLEPAITSAEFESELRAAGITQ